MTEEARAAVVDQDDERSVEACYVDPDVVVPAPRGECERRISSEWVLVVLTDGTVAQAFRRH